MRAIDPASVRAGVWRQRTSSLVAAAVLLRLYVASSTDWSDTEAYYAQWARFPAWSYYDHPPGVAWVAWLFGQLGTAPAVIRLAPVMLGAVFAALLYRLAARLFSPRAAFCSVALVTAMPAFEFVGFLLNPEALLAPLWVLFLLLLLELEEQDEWWRPLVLGLVIGASFLAKYTAVLAVPVTLLYLAGSAPGRRWFRRPSLYAGGLVALVVVAPVVAWNATQGWPSIHLHLGERMTRPVHEGIGGALLRVLGGQLVDFHPVLFPAMLAVLVYAIARARGDAAHRFLATASAPVLGFLFFVMTRAGDSEPHWTLIGYVPLAVVAGGIIDGPLGRLRAVAAGVLEVSLSVTAAAGILYAAFVATPSLAYALPRYDPNADPYVETLGWDRVRTAVVAEAVRLGPASVAMGAHNVLCGHLQAALDDSPPVYCASLRRTEFDFIGRRTAPAGAPVVFVDSDRYPQSPEAVLPDYVCTSPADVDVARGDRLLARYHVHACRPIAVP